jgi:hypothetical protein
MSSPQPQTVDDEVVEDAEDVDERTRDDITVPASLVSHKTPTPAEREKHEITHLPFASWNVHCTTGKSKENSHRSLPAHADSCSLDQVPVAQLAYWFAASRHEPNNTSSIFTVTDVNTGWTECCQLPEDNNSGGVAFVSRALRTLGYTRACMHADAKVARVALAKTFSATTQNFTYRVAPKRPHGSQGVVERHMQSVQEQLRTLISDLEQGTSFCVLVTSPIFAGLLRHRCFLLNPLDP